MAPFPNLIRYIWAFPGTAIGLLFVLLALLTGGSIRMVRGALEVNGGLTTRWFLRHSLLWMGPGAVAMTLGHVILGINQAWLDQTRDHEHVHVQQYERWGLFFLPAYFLAALWAFLRGGHPYRDNYFERQAFDQAG